MLRSRLVRRALRLIRWWKAREAALAAVTWVAFRVLPSRPIAVVHGFPDSEGNAVEVVRALVRHYPGTIYWLRNGDQPTPWMNLPGVPAGKIVNLRVNTVPAFVATWRAELTFFTHGMLTAVKPPRSRLVVNLWHGEGPKPSYDLPRCASTVAVAATDLWAREKARMFRLRERDVAALGNPRLDSALARPVSETRSLLGLSEHEYVALWLPTFRRGSDGKHFSWADGEALSDSLTSGITVPDDVTLLVKPHPMDTDDYAGLGATVVTNEDLAVTGVTVLQLLAASDALITDASSAWVDYLTWDRPVGFFLPDLERYGELRGYNVPNLFEVLPGPVMRDVSEVGRFLAEARDGRAARPSTYTDVMTRVGYRGTAPVTEHLFDWLDEYQRARGRRPLFNGSRVAVPSVDLRQV